MKIAFVHISDIHSKHEFEQPNKKEQFIAAIRGVCSKIDAIVLICSGDVAFSGKMDEYYGIIYFFEGILKEFKKMCTIPDHVYFHLVPGNHDLEYDTSEAISATEIENFFREKKQEEQYNSALQKMNSFFEYANFVECFKNSKTIDVKVNDINGFKIQVNLLNTAPFSVFNSSNDKGLHYIPETCLDKMIKPDYANIAITIMHHGIEWLYQPNKESVEKIIFNNTDILFQGHEHTINSVITSDGNNSIVISKGGEYSSLLTKESAFLILLLDTDTMNYAEHCLKWSSDDMMFIEKTTVNKGKITPKSNNLFPNEEFLQELSSDSRNASQNIKDFFVFPDLETKSNQRFNSRETSSKISENDFWDNLFKEKLVNVMGKENSGKTTFLKIMFLSALKNKGLIPLFMNKDSFSSLKPNSILEHLFREQYSKYNVSFERYKQTSNEKKIFFIDDFDLITKPQVKNKLLV